MTNSPVRGWNDAVIDAVQRIADSDPAQTRVWRGTGPAARLYALLNVAMHDAMAGIGGGDLQQRWIKIAPPSGVNANVAASAAIGAGHRVLSAAFDAQPLRAEFDQRRDDLRQAHGGGQPAKRAYDYGEQVAQALLDDARWATPDPNLDPHDDPHLPRDPEPIGTFGFARTAASYRRLTPFVLDRPDRFHAPPPPEPTTFQYARDWHEVYIVGRRETRAKVPDSYESLMARFWGGGTGTAQESGFWIQIALAVLADRSLGAAQEAKVMTAVAVAICDSMISCWNSKWTYTYWRPTFAIRHGDEDGNGATFSDPDWLPYNGMPNTDPKTVQGASPEHTSGTATFAAASAVVLARAFGDQTTFTVDLQKRRPDRQAGAQTFVSFGVAADVAANGRIWNGIHFRFSGEAALGAGRRIGGLVADELKVSKLS